MKGIRFRILNSFKSLHPSYDHHIQNQDKFSFPTLQYQNNQSFNEECKAREEEDLHFRLQSSNKPDKEPKSSLSINDEAEDVFQECNEEAFHEEKEVQSLEQICPPGGSNSVVLYTTSLRGIRKTFEDCQTIKFLLDSFQIIYHEKDVSMDLEFREELWKIIGERVIPPRLFIKGRLVGGAEEVVSLHERGELKTLLQGMPLVQSNHKCIRCNSVRFVLCCSCHGSKKIFHGEARDGSFSDCSCCNENGLIKCPLCF